jgi:NAD(P)H-hydrate epimerase
MKIPNIFEQIPYLDSSQMVEIDRIMIDEFGIQLLQMMENAGSNLAQLANIRFFDNNPVGKRVFVLAGPGGNGGGVLVCARFLHNWGADVRIFITRSEPDFSPVPHKQLNIAHKMNIPIHRADEIVNEINPDLIIDGIIGYSLNGAPRDLAADLIRWVNQQKTMVLSLDIPSGLDATQGKIYEPVIQATATMTLALPKEGLRQPGAESTVGELYLADIGVPPELYAGYGINLNIRPIFAKGEILRIN